MDYHDFLLDKMELAKDSGFDISIDDINPILKPHQKVAVQWAVKGGRRAQIDAPTLFDFIDVDVKGEAG